MIAQFTTLCLITLPPDPTTSVYVVIIHVCMCVLWQSYFILNQCSQTCNTGISNQVTMNQQYYRYHPLLIIWHL